MIGSGWRRARAAWGACALVVASLLLAGCGGGGGGGDGGGSNFSVTLDRTSVSFVMDRGGPLPQINVIATGTGTPPSTLFVGAVVEGIGIDPVIPISIAGTTATITLQPSSGLAAGTYNGRVILSACTDAACNNRIGGTPVAVSYRVEVRPSFGTDPGAVTQNSIGGQAATQRVAVSLPLGTTGFTLTGGAPWLRATAGAGEIVLDFLPWRAGFFSTTLELEAGGNRIPLPVFFQVSLPAGGESDLSVDPESVALVTTEGASSEARAVTVTPASWSGGVQPAVSVRYPVGGPSGWLEVLNTLTGVQLQANAASLSQGTYTATLEFTPAEPATVRMVPVSLTVGPGLVRPADWPIDVHAETGADALVGSQAVTVAQGPERNWTASSDQAWLELTTAAGRTGSGSVAWRVNSARLAALANFEDHAATVTLTADTPLFSPVSFQVIVSKRVPEVQFLGPATVVSGRMTRLTVRGRGFGPVADLDARLAAAGAVPGLVTRVSETELQVNVTPAAEGTVAVGVGNALGLSPASAALAVVPARRYTYAAVPSAGIKRAIIVDARRQSVYAVNVGNETLNRFRFDGTGWALDAAAVPSILDAGLTPDQSSLLVSSTPGTLRLLDPATLATGFTLEVAEGLARNLSYLGYGIATTNDGYSWLPSGTGGWNELLRFDHRTRQVVPRPSQPELVTSFYGGPWAMVSRDGGTMAVVQSGGISPAPPALVWRSSDPLLRTTGTELTFFYDATWSDDGSRIVMDGYEVRDGSFALVGTITPVSATGGSWVRMSATISPDGRRTYLLAYADSAFSGADILPRVFVFDSSERNPATAVLPIVGEIELADYPGCRSLSSSVCELAPVRLAVAPDGQTLFLAGNERFLVVPVPDEVLGTAAASRARARMKAPTPWRAPATTR